MPICKLTIWLFATLLGMGFIRLSVYSGQATDIPSNLPTAAKAIPIGERDPFVGKDAGQFRDDNGPKIALCWCPPGSFEIGDAKNSNGEPPLKVTLTRGFWIGKYEINQKQWNEVTHNTPWRNHDRVQEGDEFPATWLSWDDAQLFCETLTKSEHASGRLPPEWEYRIPTEWQWEYSSRAGVTTRYTFGERMTELPEHAWYRVNAKDKGEQYAHACGLKKANRWGLHDVQGNVLEWCKDWYASRPSGGADLDSIDGTVRRVVARGGDWSRGAELLHLSQRESLLRSHRDGMVGLRVVLVYRERRVARRSN